MQQLALIIAKFKCMQTSNLHLHIIEYIQLASYSQYKKLQDRENPNPYIKIHPSSKNLHQGKNVKFS